MEPEPQTRPEGPPKDAEDWTDDQWLTWLKATDGEVTDAISPPSVASRVVHSTGGQMLGQAMMGLAIAMYGPKQEEVIIVAEGDGEPADDEPFTVKLNPDQTGKSIITFKTGPNSRDTTA
ncbi:MAG: hypothetical protein ABSE75_10880 [Acidimicrobiales bacterium]